MTASNVLIQALAPKCRIVERALSAMEVEKDDKIYCCAHCAKQEGVTEVRDRA
ncbi:MAG: hypothetical protein WBW28_16855 [Pseudolabrys sp.]